MPTNNYRYKNRHPQVRDVVELSGNNEDLAVVMENVHNEYTKLFYSNNIHIAIKDGYFLFENTHFSHKIPIKYDAKKKTFHI